MQRFLAALAAFLVTSAMTLVVSADDTSDAIEVLRGVQPGSTNWTSGPRRVKNSRGPAGSDAAVAGLSQCDSTGRQLA